MLSNEELPPQLADAIEEFRVLAEGEGFGTADGARNNCNEASDMFTSTLSNLGLCGAIEHYSFYDGDWDDPETELDVERFPFAVGYDTRYHWAVRSMGFIVDWTARQFDSLARFPAVWRINDHDRRSTRKALSEDDETAQGDCGIYCLCSARLT